MQWSQFHALKASQWFVATNAKGPINLLPQSNPARWPASLPRSGSIYLKILRLCWVWIEVYRSWMSGQAARYRILHSSNGKPPCSLELTAMVHKIQVSAIKLHFVSSCDGPTWPTESATFTQWHTRYLNMHLMLEDIQGNAAANEYGKAQSCFFFLFFDCFLGWHAWMLNTWRGTKIHPPPLSLSLTLSLICDTHTETLLSWPRPSINQDGRPTGKITSLVIASSFMPCKQLASL